MSSEANLPQSYQRTPQNQQVLDQLMMEAGRQFRRKGYSATTTRDLAQTIGVRPPSLYYYIENKQQLLFMICESALISITNTVTQSIENVSDPIVQIERLIDAHITTVLTDRDKHSTMLMELRSLSGSNRASIVRLRTDYESLVRQVIINAQTSGKLRSDISGERLALFMLSLMNWSIFWYSPDSPPSIAEIAKGARAIFLDGAICRDVSPPVDTV